MSTSWLAVVVRRCGLAFTLFLAMSAGLVAQQPAPGIIQGRVFQVDGLTPIGGAMVLAYGLGASNRYAEATTEADGRYLLTLPQPDNYRIRASAPGYARVYFDNVTPSEQAKSVPVASGSATTIDFRLTEGGTISGYIYEVDGVTPISGAQVFVRPGEFFFDDGFRATTAADGSYAVGELALGQYSVTAEAAGYALYKYYDGIYGFWDAGNVNVVPPATTRNINIRVDRSASVSGYVRTAEGTPIQGALLLADPVGQRFEGIWTRSDSEGGYTLSGLPPARYVVWVTGQDLPGWYVGQIYNMKYKRSQADTITLISGQGVTGVDFFLEEGGVVTGQVVDKQTNTPLTRIAIWTSTIDGDTPPALGLTDNSEGKYSLRFKPGSYLIQTGMPTGYITQWYRDAFSREDATPVVVNLRQETAQVNFYLPRPGSISGWVYEKDGKTPIASANVFAFPVDPKAIGSGANTGLDGTYKIEGLPSGSYVAQVTVTNHVSANRPADVTAPNETPNINFALDSYPFKVTVVGQAVIGNQGGSVTISDSLNPLVNAGVDVPAGALLANTVINLGWFPDQPSLLGKSPPGIVICGWPIHAGPEGLQFAKPARLKVPYNQPGTDSRCGADPSQLFFVTFDIPTSSWGRVGGTTTVDATRRSVTTEVSHFSIFALAKQIESIAGDINVDGKVDCGDLALVKRAFGKRSDQSGFDSRADINADGVVDVRDLAFVSQKLQRGTRCS